MTPLATPDSTALIVRPGLGPPATRSIASPNGAPSSSSATPACCTSPTTVAIATPGDWAVPMLRYQSAPRPRIGTTLASVSTLFTSVGFELGTATPSDERSMPADQPICGMAVNSP